MADFGARHISKHDCRKESRREYQHLPATDIQPFLFFDFHTKSYPNSSGYNELRLKDKAGSEEVYLQGEKDWNLLIKNDKRRTVAIKTLEY